MGVRTGGNARRPASVYPAMKRLIWLFALCACEPSSTALVESRAEAPVQATAPRSIAPAPPQHLDVRQVGCERAVASTDSRGVRTAFVLLDHPGEIAPGDWFACTRDGEPPTSPCLAHAVVDADLIEAACPAT